MMKKLLLLLTVAIAMLALPLAAHADKTKWTNPNYDFNKYSAKSCLRICEI